MKILDVDLFQDGIQRNITMLDRLISEMEAIHHAVNGLVQMEDQLKGAGGNAIRSFYQECHLPFLHFFQLFSEQFKQVLNQMEAALHSLEPDSSGYILETFLDGELEQGLTLIGELTASLTDEANSIMNQVSDIVALPHLDDSGVQEGVISSKRKRDDTLMQLYEFDALQTFALNPIEHGLQTMDTWLTDLEGLFTDGVTDIDFRSNQWAAISMNSGLKTAIEQQTSRVNGGLESSNQENLIGTEITPGTFRALEGKKTKTIHRGAYGSFNLLKFHLYENGLIIKEYQLGTSKPIQYVVVNEVEEEFEDGGVRELDGYFEGTKLAFVDYLRPHAIVKKGFKLAFISGAKISKYKGDLSVKKTPTVENKSKGSVNGSKEAGNPNKVTGKYQVGAYKDIKGVEGLDAHHAGQKAAMKKLVDDYDLNTAPAINVPKVGHTIKGPNGIVSRSTKGIDNPRQLLARDIRELRRVYDDIPNSDLKELIELNKKMYPEMRK
ncbi:LXG domain-containing protein [Psychrobacillus sp. FSL K6-2365]|uniref:ribonuclease YeeF family protein n=1 Tax=Psychrobacillus sp. FSL K6-2365 TaxID=2921546 RepID=UPI0030FC0F85